jgi:hypothetical protein
LLGAMSSIRMGKWGVADGQKIHRGHK